MKKCVTVLLAMLLLISTLPLTALAEGTAGTYTGTGMGFGGEIVVEVDVTADGIGAIRVISHSETAGIGSVAAERLPAMMLEAQSPYVDVISGATITSTAMQDAVADAMAQSGMEIALPPAPEDLYGPNGPWSSWTAEQKSAAESWTDYQWNTYWDQYNTAANAPSDQYWNDHYTWREEHYPTQPEDDYLYEIKKEMGMPYPNGANVSLNGKYLDFGGIAPAGDVYVVQVPFRAFLEGLGGKVAYQDGKFIATMPNGTSIAAEPDSAQLTYTVGDKINTVEMYGPPVVENRVTYVEAESLAWALGLGVDYDYYYDVLHLTDWAAITEEIDGRFTTINTILAAEHKSYDSEKTYAVHLGGSVAGTLYGEKKSDTATFSVAADGIVNAKALEGSLQVKLDQGGMRDTIFKSFVDTSGLNDSNKNLAKDALDLLSNFKVDIRADLTEGKSYLRGNSLSKIPDYPLPDNVWLEMDGAVPDMGVSSVVSEKTPLTMAALLRQYEASSNFSSRTAPAQWVRQMANVMEQVLGDDNFTTSKSGSTAAYTAKADLDKFLAGIAVGEEMDEAGLAAVKTVLPKLDFTFTARLKGNEYLDAKFDLSARVGGPNPADITVKMSGNQETANMTFGLKGTYIGALEFKFDVSAKESTRVPATAPAAGEKVESLSDYMG